MVVLFRRFLRRIGIIHRFAEVVLNVLSRLLELLHRLAQALGQFRQALGTEEEQDDDETLLQPQVFILPSGEIGEFSLALRHRDELDHVYLQTISPWQLALADEAEAYE